MLCRRWRFSSAGSAERVDPERSLILRPTRTEALGHYEGKNRQTNSQNVEERSVAKRGGGCVAKFRLIQDGELGVLGSMFLGHLGPRPHGGIEHGQ